MVDEVDAAQEKEEIGLADAIRNARTGAPVAVATGRCLWCDEIVSDEARVVRLRAYGNAINAVQAQAFIESVMEAA